MGKVDPDDTLSGRMKVSVTKKVESARKHIVGTVAVAGALGAIAAWFGLSIITPGERMADLELRHRADMEAQQQFHDTVITPRVSEVDSEVHEIQSMIVKSLKGECLENPAGQLIAQDLDQTCRCLGIDPQTKWSIEPPADCPLHLRR